MSDYDKVLVTINLAGVVVHTLGAVLTKDDRARSIYLLGMFLNLVCLVLL